MKRIFAYSAIVALFFGTSFYALAQCNTYAKNRCKPGLAPYLHNGVFNSLNMSPGETAELQMTFFIDTEYRLMICGDDRLGDVAFRVLRQDGSLVFDSKNRSNAKFWDFSVNSTQKFTILVDVPKSGNRTGIEEMGCVAVLAGYKPGN